MGLPELFILSIGLAMDAFAVSVCQGLTMKKASLYKMFIIGLYFGIFQATMPLIGFFAGNFFADKIEAFDHWIAFGLLVFLGVKMLWESRKRDEDLKEEPKLTFKYMLPLALATSIDAMAVGISFAFLRVNIIEAVIFIGAITLIISMLGVKIGSIFGSAFKLGAEILGGIILIAIGIKILLEHLGILIL